MHCTDNTHRDIAACAHRARAAQIISIFEDLLDRHNITLPSDDRENDVEEARIFGTDYYTLEDEITKLLADEGEL